jgi:hypothetical protein
MGDREQERPSTNRAPSSNTQSFQGRVHHEPSSPTLEEARCILTDGISHGELRDEIYCQLMKQLNGNPSTYVDFSCCLALFPSLYLQYDHVLTYCS